MILRRLFIATPVLVAAVVAVLYPRTAVSARTPVLSPFGSNSCPNVDPADIVNIDFNQSLAAGQSVTVFSVPVKRHLIVTQIGLVNGSGGFDTHLVERTKQGTVVKLFSQFSVNASFGLGLAFEPGSSVDVVNTRTTSDPVTLHLFGYLAPSGNLPAVKPDDVFDTMGMATLAPGQTVRMFDVPNDRWLVLTSNAISGTGEFALLEDFSGTQTEKPLMDFASNPIGIAFRPGSSVVLRSDVQSGTYNYRWLLTGYLAK
jgi:hypothetical protein